MNKGNLEFMILQYFPHPDFGTILTGILKNGKIFEGQKLLLYLKNSIHDVTIRSIHLDGKPINKISGPRTVSICISYNDNIKNFNGFLTNQYLKKIENNIEDEVIYKDNQILNKIDYKNYYQTNDKIFISGNLIGSF